MSNTGIEVEILLKDLLHSSGQGMLSVPFAEPADASEVRSFITFGITNPGDTFSLGWSITVDENSEARIALAFVTGTLTYETRFGEPGILTLTNADALGSFVRQSELPDWFPFPDYVIYNNIDEQQTDLLIRDYLEANTSITEAIYAATGLITVDEVIAAFFAGTLTTGIPVSAGQPIGVAATFGSGIRQQSIYMQTEDGAIDGLYLDPAIYHTHMENFFPSLSEHVLIDSLQKVFAGPVANGVVRYVSMGGGTSGDFTNPTSPANLVSTALTVCNSYDVIVITDTGTDKNSMQTEETVISIPITITSLSPDIAIEHLTPNFPILKGTGRKRVILIDEVSEGIVTLDSLSITEGNSKEGSSLPISGGGILIKHSHQTYIRNCYIYSNQTFLFLGDENGFGGGIHMYHSSAYIYQNRISGNTSHDRGGGIGIWGYGWPVVERNLIIENQARGGRPDGGAIGVEIAYPNDRSLAEPLDLLILENAWNLDELLEAKNRYVIFKLNSIINNSAEDDGGGVYLSVLSRANFIENEIAFNSANGSGGGIRASLGSDVKMLGDHIHDNRANQGHGESGGGGIGTRNVSLRLSNVTIENNFVEGFAGGGLFFSTSSEGDYPFNAILSQVFGISQSNLEILGSTSITNNHCSMIQGGADYRKGGGAYVLRYKELAFSANPLTVIAFNFGAITNNHIDKVIGSTQWYVDPTTVTYPNSQDFHLEDMIARSNNPIDASNVQNFMTGNQFIYP